jgi:hypothetical protein
MISMKNRSRSSRRHLLAVVWFLVFLVAGQFALGWYIDQTSVEVRDPEYAAKRDRLRKLLATHPTQDWTLFLGSSRGAQGFAARRFQPERLAFNFAIPGGGPMVQQIVYHRLKKEGIAPTEIFLEIMPNFFNGTMGDKAEMRMLDTARLQFQELAVLSESPANVHGRYRRWLLARTIPEWRHSRELRERIGLDQYRPDTRPEAPEDAIEFDGWHPTHGDYFRTESPRLHRLAHNQYDRFYTRFEPAHSSLLRLKELIREVRSDGIKITLIIMPEASHFRELASDQHRTGFASMLESLRAEFNLPLLDTRDWVPDEEFFDGHHLFPEGGERLTQRLKKRLVGE